MNTDNTNRYSKPTWAFGLFGIVAVLGLVVVLGLAVARVLNPETTLPRPEAAGISNSKLSAFFLSSSGQGATDIINACPKVIKVINTDSGAMTLVNAYKQQCPNGKVLLRVFTSGPELLGDPRTAANTYFNSRLSGALGALGSNISKINYIEAPNEAEEITDWSGGNEANWLREFYLELADLVEAKAANLGICPSIAVGDMGTGGTSTQGAMDNAIKFKMQVSQPMWKHVKDLGGAMCYHAYSYEMTKDAEAERWLPFRYRIMYDYFRNPDGVVPGLDGIPVILSEAGAETLGGHNGGWQNKGLSASQYQDWLAWFDSEIKKDSYVLGATIYAYGSTGKGSSYDIGPIANWLASFIKSGGGSGGGGGTTPTPTPGGGGGGGTTPTPTPTPTPGGGGNQGCNSSSPAPVWACYQNGINGVGRGNCAYCWSQYNGNQTPTPTPGGQSHLECVAATSGGGKVKLNDNAAEIKYEGPWKYVKGGGGTSIMFQQDYHFAPAPLSASTVTKNLGASFTFKFTGDQVGVRLIQGGNRGYADVFIDDVKVDSLNMHTGGAILDTPAWQSAKLACKEHTLKVTQSDKDVDNHGKLVAVDFLEYNKCSGTTGFACAKVAGAGANKDGCTTAGASCTQGGGDGGGSSAATAVSKCWGNPDGVGGRCYDCNGDATINILDFSCFRKNWMQTVN